MATGQQIANCIKSLKDQCSQANTHILSTQLLYDMPQMHDYPPNIQQDAHEFLMALFQFLHEEQHQATGQVETTVNQTVFLQLSHLHSCENCGESSASSETVNYISCPLDSQMLTQITIEPSGQISSRPCTTCGHATTMCDSEITFHPTVLFVTVIRFNAQLQKLNHPVRLSPQLITKHNICYKLAAVLYHSGTTIHDGHYFVDILCASDKKWYRCDDHEVHQSDLPTNSSMAYILTYEKAASVNH